MLPHLGDIFFQPPKKSLRQRLLNILFDAKKLKNMNFFQKNKVTSEFFMKFYKIFRI